VIALCRAIEANDLDEIDRLVAAGANVNALGKGNMTPLLWAFPDNNLPRFKRLLEHGADPNVVVESDFGTIGNKRVNVTGSMRRAIHPGDSVTTLSAGTDFPGYFQTVMQHGGDPNIHNRFGHESPLHIVIKAFIPIPEKKERLQLLIEKGADLDQVCGGGTPAMRAVGWGGQYWIALLLLDAGADPAAYNHTQTSKLIHKVVADEPRSHSLDAQSQAEYRKLVQWLGDHGESVEEAREDRERWRSRRFYPPQKIKELREKEVAERLEREKAQAKEGEPEKGKD
jgi:ankyrin repeat protein